MSKIRNLFLHVLCLITSTIFFPFQYKNKSIAILRRFKIVYGLFAIHHVAMLFSMPKKKQKTKKQNDLSLKSSPNTRPL